MIVQAKGSACALGVAVAFFCLSAEAAPVARGFGVVAVDGAKDPAGQIARAIYARASLRPDASLDESRAQVLIGEAAPPALADIAARRAAIKGEDAASQQLLSGLATDFHLRGVIVVSCESANAAPPTSTWGGRSAPDPSSSAAPATQPPTCSPVAKLFLAATPGKAARFDPDTYVPDISLDATKPLAWTASVAAIDASYGDASERLVKAAPAAATHPSPLAPK
ncbi:MAG: hypothetical protein ABI551_25240, partial [Polyangiaceae bacterium]